jgi:hypothetical protein
MATNIGITRMCWSFFVSLKTVDARHSLGEATNLCAFIDWRQYKGCRNLQRLDRLHLYTQQSRP